jgi:hypothetical protein
LALFIGYPAIPIILDAVGGWRLDIRRKLGAKNILGSPYSPFYFSSCGRRCHKTEPRYIPAPGKASILARPPQDTGLPKLLAVAS